MQAVFFAGGLYNSHPNEKEFRVYREAKGHLPAVTTSPKGINTGRNASSYRISNDLSFAILVIDRSYLGVESPRVVYLEEDIQNELRQSIEHATEQGWSH